MITATVTEVRDDSGQVVGLYQQVPGRRTYSARYLAPNGAVWCDLGVALTRPEVVEAALHTTGATRVTYPHYLLDAVQAR